MTESTTNVTGAFITFEGIDGCGKSTQVRNLVEWLQAQDHECIVTREPGGSPGAEEIRQLLVTGDTDRWSAETELLLFTAARRDHIERRVRPALTRGAVVVCDRFVDTTRVFQGLVQGVPRAQIDALHRQFINTDPTLTIILDLDPVVGFERIAAATKQLTLDPAKTAEQRFEEHGLDFQRQARDGFLAIAEEFPERCVVIDGADSEEVVAERIRAALQQRLPQLFPVVDDQGER